MGNIRPIHEFYYVVEWVSVKISPLILWNKKKTISLRCY